MSETPALNGAVAGQQPSPAAERKTKIFQKTAWRGVEEAATPLRLADPELGEALGLSRDTVGHWRRAGMAPAWALPAVEGLVARAGLRAEQAAVMLVSVPANKRVAVESFLDAIGLSRTWV